MKELAALTWKAHVALLVQEIFEDYIRQHEGDLIKKREEVVVTAATPHLQNQLSSASIYSHNQGHR
jgi:hypothetical protein